MSRQVKLYYSTPIFTKSVVCTGFFDNWAAEQKMVVIEIDLQKETKLFYIKLNIPENEKELVFKFIVDNTWQLSPAYRSTYSGVYENNIIYLNEELPEEKRDAEQPETEQAKEASKNVTSDFHEKLEARMVNTINPDLQLKPGKNDFTNMPQDSGSKVDFPNVCTGEPERKTSNKKSIWKKVLSCLYPCGSIREKTINVFTS